MGVTVETGEVYRIGNHKAVETTLRFSGNYPHGGFECSREEMGLTELAGMVPLAGHDGFTFDHSERGILRVYHAGHEVAGPMLDGVEVTFLCIGH